MPKEKEQSVSDSIDLELVRERYTPMAEAGYRFLTPSILWDKHGGQICEFSLFYPKAQEYAEAPELVLGLLALVEGGYVDRLVGPWIQPELILLGMHGQPGGGWGQAQAPILHKFGFFFGPRGK